MRNMSIIPPPPVKIFLIHLFSNISILHNAPFFLAALFYSIKVPIRGHP